MLKPPGFIKFWGFLLKKTVSSMVEVFSRVTNGSYHSSSLQSRDKRELPQ